MDEHKKEIGIPEAHNLVQIDTKWGQRKGQDTDPYWYDEVDQNGVIVGKYVVKDSTSMYPPYNRSISYEKVAKNKAYCSSRTANAVGSHSTRIL